MACPKCGSENVQSIADVKGKGFGVGKGCIGSLILGPIGWLCGLCGMGKTRTEILRVCNSCGHRFK